MKRGDRVKHRVAGVGTVQKSAWRLPDTWVEVHFDDPVMGFKIVPLDSLELVK